MYDQRLLPGEQRAARRRNATLEEAVDTSSNVTPRSVRSIRQRFESEPPSPSPASAPATPAKKRAAPRPAPPPRAQTKTQAQLAAFLKSGSDNPNAKTRLRKSADKNVDPKKRVPSGRDAVQNGSVGSLIEKWQTNSVPRSSVADRVPLQERDPQRVDDPIVPKKPHADSVDTFGSSNTDFEAPVFPKTDPGPRLEPINSAMSQQDKSATCQLAAAADAVATGDHNLRDLVSRGVHQKAVQEKPKQQGGAQKNPKHPLQVPNESSVDARRRSGPSAQRRNADMKEASPSPSANDIQQVNTPPSNDEGATNVQEQHIDAQVDDWGAGDAYIRELFGEAEETAERAVQCDENEDYFEAFELYWVVVDLYYKVIPFLSPEEGEDVHERIKMYTRRCGAIREAFEDDPEGQDEIEVRIADASAASAKKEEQIQESFTAGLLHSQNTGQTNAQISQSSPVYASARSQANLEDSPTAVEDTQNASKWPQGRNTVEKRTGEAEIEGNTLQKNRFPDYPSSKPLAAIPEAPRNPTQAHRNSLSRPISRSAVRASTNSVSRERVAEMQERVQVMQECLNNFTVKRKHLGPARALELHVTTLNANTFGDLKKLEPLAPELEHKWSTELEVLLSMLQEIKEVQPGAGYVLREDIARHLPALERCDRSVRKTMRSFAALAGHVQYVDRETAGGSAGTGKSRRRWWVKVPVVTKGGLPSDIRHIVEEAEKEMRGVFKVCHEINVEVVKSMPVPKSFVDSLPRHAREIIPRSLKDGLTTWGMFKVSDYMKDTNQYNKEAAKDLTSRLEKVSLIWEAKTSNKSFLSRTFDIRGERFHQAMTAFRRCQNAIRDLRREWPTMQHTDLDMAKIQHNEDIGCAGLEAYSRALESRAYRLLTRIRELLDADAEARGTMPPSDSLLHTPPFHNRVDPEPQERLHRSNTSIQRSRGRS